MDLKGSKTEQNLLAAFAGESMARNRYTYYAAKASEEGYVMVSDIFKVTADNEKEHAEVIFNFLNGVGDTRENLKAGVNGEREEWSVIYKKMEQDAREEGFNEIAAFFAKVAEVEQEHEKRYAQTLETLENGKMFKSDEEQEWVCLNCGYVHKGKEAPNVCPVCKKKQEYFTKKPN